ncbi:MAG: hypothetical protein ACOYIR_09615, partial [Christensenellales bacterium]
MKRLLSFALAAMLAIGLCACSDQPPQEPITTPDEGDAEILGEVPGQPVVAATPAPRSPEQKEI